MLLYYITDRTQFPGDQPERHRRLLAKIAEAASCGVDYIQLRERDLPARELEKLAGEALQSVATAKLTAGNRELRTALLINSRTDVAIAAGADGVHLRSDDISPDEVRQLWGQCGASARPLIGVSCHSVSEVSAAASQNADFAVFAPVFGKANVDVPATGLDALRKACQQEIPVLALGGITVENARSCLQAGAAGIAGIRLFQENALSQVVEQLRGLQL